MINIKFQITIKNKKISEEIESIHKKFKIK